MPSETLRQRIESELYSTTKVANYTPNIEFKNKPSSQLSDSRLLSKIAETFQIIGSEEELVRREADEVMKQLRTARPLAQQFIYEEFDDAARRRYDTAVVPALRRAIGVDGADTIPELEILFEVAEPFYVDLVYNHIQRPLIYRHELLQTVGPEIFSIPSILNIHKPKNQP